MKENSNCEYEKLNTIEFAEYENCSFKHCDFSNQDLSEYKFIDCIFQNCNLSLVKLSKTAFQDIQFIHCKLLGIRFEECNPFSLSFSFKGCLLNHATFYQLKIPKTKFAHCSLLDVDFTGTDLSGSSFESCNLSGAIFDRTNLEKADLRKADGFSIDPSINRMKNAKFATQGLPGLLYKYKLEIE